MKTILANEYFLLFSRVFISIIFIFAGIEKIGDPSSFAESITNYKMFPEFLVNLFAVVIPWAELAVGILLLFGTAVKENTFILSVLLTFFVILIFVAVLRGLNIDCGCFGTISASKVGLQKIIENILLLLLTINVLYFGSKKYSLSFINI